MSLFMKVFAVLLVAALVLVVVVYVRRGIEAVEKSVKHAPPDSAKSAESHAPNDRANAR
jgi:hypothetical protein